MKLFKFYVIPFLMIVVATIQLFNVNDGLSSWKGGGFGMYSELHPHSRQLVINGSFISNDSLSSFKTKRALRSYLYYPRPKFAEILIDHLEIQEEPVLFEIWQPYFDNKNAMSKKLIHTYILK